MVNRSISVGPGRDRTRDPGSADRQVSALRYITDCATLATALRGP